MDQTYTDRLHGFGFDQMLYSSPERFVLLKFSIPSSKQIQLDVLQTHSKGFYVFKKDGEEIFAVYFYGFTKQQVENFDFGLKKSARFSFSLLPQAQADEDACPPSQLVKYAQYFGTAMVPQVFLQRAANCAVTALPHVWESTKGLWNSAVELVTEPSKAWDKIVHNAEMFAQFVKEIDTRVVQMFDALKGVDPELAQHLVCSAIGEMAPDIALMIVGGVTAGKLAARMALMVEQLSRKATFLKNISKIFRSNPELAKNLATGAMSCAAK